MLNQNAEALSLQSGAIALSVNPVYISGTFMIALQSRAIRALRLAVQDIALSRR